MTCREIKPKFSDWKSDLPINGGRNVFTATEEKIEKLEAENKELRERLEKRIKELEKNVKELKKEQPRILGDGGIGTSFVVGSSPFISRGGGFIGLNDKVCSECGKSYSEDPLTPTFLATTFPFRDLCPECKRKVS